MLLLSVTLIFSSCNSSNSNDNPDNEPYEYHNKNIDVLSSVLDSSVASSVVSALEESCAIEEKTKLVAQDLIKVGDNCYELYAGLMLRFYINNGQISLYTFETTYSEDSKILLYDSSSHGVIKVLTADERNNFIYTQRRAIVHNTVTISPCEGVLLHNALGSTKIDLTFNNKSDSQITYLNIVITPYMGGTSFSYNNKAYVLDCDLPVSCSVDKSITTTEWTNYDSYKITQVTVMFNDGSTIGFNSFDCQFLNGIKDNDLNQVPDDETQNKSDNDLNQVPDDETQNKSEEDNTNTACIHQLDIHCTCIKCKQTIHSLDQNYHCQTCNQGSILIVDNYVYFGSYPQRLVVEEMLVQKLNQIAEIEINDIQTVFVPSL